MNVVAAEARRFLRGHLLGTLATHSTRVEGYPFGSVVPIVPDQNARPVVLVSTLAEHTRNLEADPRTSLLAHGFSLAAQGGPRLTLIGDACRIDDDAMRARYLRYFPEAGQFASFGDFGFWRLEPRAVLFVRGFGRIDWVQPAEFAAPANHLEEIEPEILAHMNGDHADALATYCRARLGVQPAAFEMVGIDCDGFDVRADGSVLRFDFEEAVTTADAVRAALASFARRSRGG